MTRLTAAILLGLAALPAIAADSALHWPASVRQPQRRMLGPRTVVVPRGKDRRGVAGPGQVPDPHVRLADHTCIAAGPT